VKLLEMFKDEINDECNVETLVVRWDYYTVSVVLLHFCSIVNPNFTEILKEILKYEGMSLPVRVQGCELCDDRGTEESSGFVVWLLQDGLKWRHF